jgi:hypothetical protein
MGYWFFSLKQENWNKNLISGYPETAGELPPFTIEVKELINLILRKNI